MSKQWGDLDELSLTLNQNLLLPTAAALRLSCKAAEQGGLAHPQTGFGPTAVQDETLTTWCRARGAYGHGS